MDELEACANDALQLRMNYIDAYYARNDYTKQRKLQTRKRGTAQIDRPVSPTSPKDIAKKSLHEFAKFSSRTESARLLATLSLLTPSCQISNTSPGSSTFVSERLTTCTLMYTMIHRCRFFSFLYFSPWLVVFSFTSKSSVGGYDF